jgi:nucleoside-diphosphate-sugar epimerase
MNILLTGGTGFLGKEIIEYFSGKHKIYAIYRNVKGVTKKNVDWIKIDLTNKRDFENTRDILKKARIDVIIHAGGATPNRAYADGNFDSTTVGTKNLIESAKSLSIKKIIFISTISVLFSKGPYATSKKIAEKVIISSGMKYVILRPETIIGRSAKDFNRIGVMLSKHKIFPIIGFGRNTSQPIASKDVLRMIDTALHKVCLSNHVYPAVGKDIITTKEMLRKISMLKNNNVLLISIPLWLAYPISFIIDLISPKSGLNVERIRTLSHSRHYSLDYLKDFRIHSESLTSFDEMISFLKL